MICFPNAKINLGLHVLGKRPDGYHNIETVFYPLPFCDILETERIDNRFKFTITGLPVPGNKNTNLVVKSYRLLQSVFNLPPVHIHLHKLIPAGAGLGGGSSDGASALKLLNNLFHLKLSEPAMSKFAGQLGSDCPFFIRNIPVFAIGRGDRFKKINVSLSGLFLVLVLPSFRILTAEAYQKTIVKPHTKSLEDIIRLPLKRWKGAVKNDFEEFAFQKHPVLGEVKEQLYSHGAIYASMTGSGSGMYGLFEKKSNIAKVFSGIRVHHFALP